MSFILDALKKSEAERQRTSTPGIADIPSPREQPRMPRWLWIVGGLLVINLASLVIVLVWQTAEPGPVESITKTLETPDAPPAPQISFSDMVAEAKEKHRETAPAPVSASRPQPEADLRPAEPEPRATQTVVASAKTLNELRAAGTLQLPDLHLDLHVYGDQPRDRFVMINMSKYAEGATLTEGPRVKQITPEGVLLEHQGTVFLLPRQ
ncbi:MAG: general secretion pathway protein GspB [Woeseiaceae bacterium]